MKKLILTWCICSVVAVAGWGQETEDPYASELGGGGASGFTAVGDRFGGGAEVVYGGLSGSGSRMATWRAVNLDQQTLIVAGSEMAPETRAEIIEDAAIMQRLLTRKTRVESDAYRPDYAMGINVQSWHSGNGPQATYLEGFGMLFPLRVEIPLVAPTATRDSQTSRKPETEWDLAKKELYGQRATAYSQSKPRKKAYDAQKVETLKTAIIGTLQNASNLRHVQSDEHVVVVVKGAGLVQDTNPLISSLNPGYGAAGGGGGTVSHIPVLVGQAGAGSTTVMTIKAKKSDIDAFADEEIDLKEFSNRVAVNRY